SSRHGRRRQARREQVSGQGTRRAEHRADRQARSSVEACSQHHRHQGNHRPHRGPRGGKMTQHLNRGRGFIFVALAAAAPTLLGAEATKTMTPVALDRSAIPTASKTPELHVPSWSKLTLANGAQLIVSERHGLPLVYVSVNLIGGAAQFDPADKPGLGGFVSSMMLEGTKSRTGDQLSEAMQSLGSNVSVFIQPETGSIGVFVMKDKLEPMLAILEDVLVNPSFPDSALERLRGRTLINLQQAKDRTASIAGVVFPKVLYTTEQPYGRTMTEQSAKSITRA